MATNQAASHAYAFIGMAAPSISPETVGRNARDSFYMPPREPRKSPPSVIGYTDISATTGTDFGSVFRFENLNDDHTSILKSWLVTTYNPIAAAGGGVNPRFPNDVNNHMMEKMELQQGGRTLQTLYGDDEHFRSIMDLNPDELAKKYQARRDNLSAAQRSALAVAGFTAISELNFWYSDAPEHCWHQWLNSAQSRFVMTTRAANAVLQTTGGTIPTVAAGTYINNVFIRHRVVATLESEKRIVLNDIASMGSRGMLYKFRDVQQVLNQAVAAGSTTANFDLSNFTKHVYRIYHYIRPSANLVATVTNNDRWSTTPILTRYIEASGQRLVPQHDHDFILFVENGDNLAGTPGDALYNVLFNGLGDIHHMVLPGIDFSLLGNPRLYQTHSAAVVAANHDFDAIGYVHNFIKVEKVGDKVVFSVLYSAAS